jgi:formate dehydrogenase subunit gamma
METRETEIAAILDRHSGREGALLPVLHDIQAAFGHIDDAAKRQVAHALNLSRAEVHGVASFYHDFRDAPAGKPVLRLCRAEACQSRGSEKLAAEAEGMAGDKVTIEPVYCLGLCTVGPNAMIGDEVHARLDAERVSELIAGMAA